MVIFKLRNTSFYISYFIYIFRYDLYKGGEPVQDQNKGKVIRMSDYAKGPSDRRKQIIWVGNARKDLRCLPDAVKENIGHQLWLLEAGEQPTDFKSMPSVGSGVYEIRVPDADGRNVGRCFYVTKFEGRLSVLHSFVKTSQKTSSKDIKKGRDRYRVLMNIIKQKKESNEGV